MNSIVTPGVPPATLTLPGGGRADLLGRYPAGTTARRLQLARLALPDGPACLDPYLAQHGQPIRYAHAAGAWPIEAWARAQGCAAMELIARPGWSRILRRHGYDITHVFCEKEL